MPNEAIIISAASVIEGLEQVVDGYPHHSHKFTTQTGSEPLIEGRPVTDYANPQPATITLTGRVSDFSGPARLAAAYAEIHRLWSQVETVRLITEWGVWPEMIIVEVQLDPVGRGMVFDVKLQHLIRVAAPVAVPPTAVEDAENNRLGEEALALARVEQATQYRQRALGDDIEAVRRRGSQQQAADNRAAAELAQRAAAAEAITNARDAQVPRGQNPTRSVPEGSLPRVPPDARSNTPLTP